MILYKTSKQDVFCVGDIHGNFGVLSNFIRTRLSNCSIICCGDIGVGFEKPAHYENVFGKMSKKMEECDVDLYMLRGNHDDPSYFNPEGNEYGRIHLVPDYSVLEVEGVGGILMVGGATSVDRQYRLGRDLVRSHKYIIYHGTLDGFLPCHWTDEIPFFSEERLAEIKKSGIVVRAVCTHTCPWGCDPLTMAGIESFLAEDETLGDSITEERKTLGSVRTWLCENGMKPEAWVYGHYHRSNREEIDGTLYVMLNLCDEHRNKLDVFDLTNLLKNDKGSEK